MKLQVVMRILTDTQDRFLPGYRHSTQTIRQPVQYTQVRISRLHPIFPQTLYRRKVYDEDSSYLPSQTHAFGDSDVCAKINEGLHDCWASAMKRYHTYSFWGGGNDDEVMQVDVRLDQGYASARPQLPSSG